MKECKLLPVLRGVSNFVRAHNLLMEEVCKGFSKKKHGLVLFFSDQINSFFFSVRSFAIAKRENGYIAILTVLIISAVVLAIATTVSLLAIGEAQSGLSLFKGEDTLTFIEGCMEDALLKTRNSNGYAGGTITRPEG